MTGTRPRGSPKGVPSPDHHQGEGLGRRSGGVLRGDLEGVGLGRTRGRCARQRRRAVAVVDEGQARGQRARKGQRRRREPVVVTLNVPALPVVNVAVAALVTAGAWITTKVKVW